MKKLVLDISRYQDPNSINYDTLSKNIDGVIIRAGYTGYGTGVSYYEDSKFEKHYNEFRKRGVPIGAYWYSCANTNEKGINEAKYFYNIIKGKKFEYPLYWDTEDQYHQAKVNKNQLAMAGKGFLDYLENKGYYVGIYASSSWLKNKLNMALLKDKDIWVAHYGVNKPSYNRYSMWQYTSTGRLNGYNGNLDLNYCYVDYPSIIKKNGLNGYKKEDIKEVKKIELSKEQKDSVKNTVVTYLPEEFCRAKELAKKTKCLMADASFLLDYSRMKKSGDTIIAIGGDSLGEIKERGYGLTAYSDYHIKANDSLDDFLKDRSKYRVKK